MLSAFQAQAVHELKAKDKSKIESLLAYGDRLLVGLSTGVLRIYRVNEQQHDTHPDNRDPSAQTDDVATPRQKAIELLREEEKFSKKPVQQLAIVKEANLLVSLSDGIVSLHDLQTYALVDRLAKTKGALCFAVTSNVIKDPDTSIPSLVSRLVVGVKRRLLCWIWNDMELAENVAEIALEGTIKTLTWSTETKIAVGMDAGFSVVDLQTEEAILVNKPASRQIAGQNTESAPGELPGVRFAAVSSSGMGYMGMGSWVPKPMCTRVSGEELLFAKDVNTLFTDPSGKPLEKRQIPWSLPPEAIGFSYPYLLALQPPEKGVLQIRNPDTLNLLQSLPVPQATILHVPQPRISLAHAGKGFLVASDRIIWRMNALPYPLQIEELVSKARYDEAVSFLNLLEDTLINDKYGRIREVQVRKAEYLFHDRKYRPALDLFTDARASVERVVRLYPRSIAGDVSSITSDEEPSDDDPFVDKPADKSANTEPKDIPVTPSKSMLGRFRAAQTPQKQQQSAEPDTATFTSPRSDTDNMSIRSTQTPVKSQPKIDKPLTGDDLKVAVRALCSYLAQSRQQVMKYVNHDGSLKATPPILDAETHRPAFSSLLPDQLFAGQGPFHIDYEAELLKVAKLVDTTLFKAYMLASPGLAGSLFRLENFCDPDVVQNALYESERYGDLIDFLHGKKLHRQSLEMLQKFGKGEVDNVDEVMEGFEGPSKTVAYLQQLPPDMIDTILEFAAWPLSVNPRAGLSIFTADTDNAERMDRHRVISYLRDINMHLESKYLEHVIDEWHDNEPSFHQRLVELYISELKDETTSPDTQVELQHHLEAFLSGSRYYNRGQTFRMLDAGNPLFFESRAIVLTELGNYKQALSIYVYQLHDYEKAEEHCTKIYLRIQSEKDAEEKAAMSEQTRRVAPTAPTLVRRDTQPDHFTEDKGNVFAMLLGLYLRPPANEQKRWPQALELLSKHGSRLPASSTLDLMPDDLAIQELQNYFRGRMRHSASLLREERIVKALEALRSTRVEGELLLGKEKDMYFDKPQGRNKRIVVGEFDHCKICHKRFGASAVRAWPDGTVTHYGCSPGQPERSRGW